MSTTRSQFLARPMVLASVAAFVLGMPLVVATLAVARVRRNHGEFDGHDEEQAQPRR